MVKYVRFLAPAGVVINFITITGNNQYKKYWIDTKVIKQMLDKKVRVYEQLAEANANGETEILLNYENYESDNSGVDISTAGPNVVIVEDEEEKRVNELNNFTNEYLKREGQKIFNRINKVYNVESDEAPITTEPPTTEPTTEVSSNSSTTYNDIPNITVTVSDPTTPPPVSSSPVKNIVKLITNTTTKVYEVLAGDANYLDGLTLPTSARVQVKNTYTDELEEATVYIKWSSDEYVQSGYASGLDYDLIGTLIETDIIKNPNKVKITYKLHVVDMMD